VNNEIFVKKRAFSKEGRDTEETKRLQKYINFCLIQMRDGFMQGKYKQFLKQNGEEKGPNVYKRLQEDAEMRAKELSELELRMIESVKKKRSSQNQSPCISDKKKSMQFNDIEDKAQAMRRKSLLKIHNYGSMQLGHNLRKRKQSLFSFIDISSFSGIQNLEQQRSDDLSPKKPSAIQELEESWVSKRKQQAQQADFIIEHRLQELQHQLYRVS